MVSSSRIEGGLGFERDSLGAYLDSMADYPGDNSRRQGAFCSPRPSIILSVPRLRPRDLGLDGYIMAIAPSSRKIKQTVVCT